MNGLYITVEYKKISATSSNGIQRKIYYQIETLKNYGHNIQFIYPYASNNTNISKILRFLPLCNNFIKWEINYFELRNVNFIYIRKPALMDKDILKFLKRCRRINNNIKILMEIPTYPYDDEIHGLTTSYLLFKDKYYRKKLKGLVDKIVTYSRDNIIFGIDTIKIPNAIKADEFNYQIREYHCKQKHMIACSSLSYWHGYDRALKGIVNYYADKNNAIKSDLLLHIVGNGEELNSYKEIVNKNNIQDYVIFHGYMSGKQLNEIYSKCCIGLDSLGRHRSKVYYNSSLKGKEYCSRGLVIVSGVDTEFDFIDNYNYYIRVPADDSSLDFSAILNKYNNIIEDKLDSDIFYDITSFAKNNFDFSVAMLPINEFLTKDGI